jgi:phenylalanyl-tRNA synthetase beta chain
VRLFDVYTGEQVELGKKSLAFSITYQSPEHTLTDEEVARAQRGIVERLKREFGAELRG